jgi:hypothetical protein
MAVAWLMRVSWKDAQREARSWIDSLQLGKLEGRLIDLREPSESLRFRGQFRTMVLRAAKRLVADRGGTAVFPDE